MWLDLAKVNSEYVGSDPWTEAFADLPMLIEKLRFNHISA